MFIDPFNRNPKLQPSNSREEAGSMTLALPPKSKPEDGLQERVGRASVHADMRWRCPCLVAE